MASTNPPGYMTLRAAGVAQSCINYKLGGPYRLFEQQHVTKSSMKSIKGEGNKYFLEFPLKDVLSEHQPTTCTAEVLYYTKKETAPKVTYKLQPEPENYTAAQDKEFYNRMKGLSKPLAAEDIPDKFGRVASDMEPIFNLALAACGFVKWQNSTEGTFYRMAVIKSVQQVIRSDDSLEFHYHMLIHENISEEMVPWLIETLWDPSEGVRVKNHRRLPKINPDENRNPETEYL